MSIIEAMAKAITTAKDNSKVAYVYEINSQFIVSAEHGRGWLFKVYPGGRKELSTQGAVMVRIAGHAV